MGQTVGVASIPLLLPASISLASIPFRLWQAQPAHGTWPPTLQIAFLNTWAFQSLLNLCPLLIKATDDVVTRLDTSASSFPNESCVGNLLSRLKKAFMVTVRLFLI